MPASTVLAGRMLVVDFDFFFPNPAYTHSLGSDLMFLYDWGHQETVLYRDLLWPIRAQGFIDAGLPLPRCTPTTGFWDRFQFATDVLLVADSNRYAGALTPPDAPGFTEIVLFDAHHDSGYHRSLDDYRADGVYSCEDWTYPHLERGTRVEVRYPRWFPDWHQVDAQPRAPVHRGLDVGGPVPGVFDTVFCCRSGSWVPAWCDDQWWAFCQAFPGPTAVLDDALRHSRWDFDHPGNPQPGPVARARRLPPASVPAPTRAATSTPGHADADLR